jgi:hypothetical protein
MVVDWILVDDMDRNCTVDREGDEVTVDRVVDHDPEVDEVAARGVGD